MKTISKFEGHSQIRSLLNNDDYDNEKAMQYLNDNAIIPASPELCYDTDRYIKLQQSKMQETDAIFKGLNLSAELKKVLICEKLPFRTKTKDVLRYYLIQTYLNRILYRETYFDIFFFDIYDHIKNFNVVSEKNIKDVRNYLECNGIYVNDFSFIKKMLCNYNNPYKNQDGLKRDFERIDNFSGKEKYSVVGRYGELEIYNMLRENLKPDEEIKWVSKDVGELFGYDIIINNVMTGKVRLIEVKTSYINGGELTLSLNEYNKLQESIRNGIEYEMYKIEYVDGGRKLFKVTHDHDEYYIVENLITGAKNCANFTQSKINPEKKVLALESSNNSLEKNPTLTLGKEL